MAARGASTKQKIVQKILATFPSSFLYNDGKEIRINNIEDGEPIQIKVTLTAAKVAVEGGSDAAVPGEIPSETPPAETTSGGTANLSFTSGETIPDEPSEDEKARLVSLLDRLGLT